MPFIPPSEPKPPPESYFTTSMTSLERGAEFRAFLDYVATSTNQTLTREQAAVLWPIFTQAMMEWLIQQRKSVDLGFCILHPVPLRANWKQAMINMVPELGPSLVGKSGPRRRALLDLFLFDTRLRDTKLLSIVGGKLLLWNIEVEPKRSWYKAVLKQEHFIFGSLGSGKYAIYVARQIQHLTKKLTSIYLSFVRQVAYPAGAMAKSSMYGYSYIKPYIPKGCVRPQPNSKIPVCLVVPRDQTLALGKHPVVADADAVLHEMSRVQSLPDDVRAKAGDEEVEP